MKKIIKNLSLLILLIFTLTGCSITVSNTEPANVNIPSQTELLEVHFIDVGQGDCILLKTPDGENMLIDAGTAEQGKKVVDYLKDQQVDKLQVLIATHPHADHIGGLPEVINNIAVNNIYMPKVTQTTRTYEKLLLAIKDKRLKINVARAGVALPISGLEAEILAPVKDTYEDLNNYSAVVRVKYGENVFLFCGDAETEAEKDILNNGAVLKAEVLKLGHHGSSSSTSADFLQAVKPAYGVIMCAAGNDYGHPHKETIDKLKKASITILRTDQQGDIIITSDGSNIKVKSSKLASNNDISSETGEYIANKKSKVLHTNNCANLSDEKNSLYFKSREAAIQQGYKPCQNCNP